MLRTRMVTAVVAVGLLLAVLFWAPRPLAQGVVALVMLAAGWEWSALARLRQPLQRVAYVLLLVLLVFVLWQSALIGPGTASLTALLLIALVWWLLALVWVVRYAAPISPQLAALCGLAVLAPLWLVLLALLTVPVRGAWLVLWLLLIVWAADVAAYAAGRTLGRVRLAPRVSPGKTREGALGGVAAGGAVALGGGLLFGLPLVGVAVLGIAVAVVSIVGDLTVSMFKRSAGVKDSGWLFPGHGGVLDRIDSLAAAAPLYLLGLAWVGGWP